MVTGVAVRDGYKHPSDDPTTREKWRELWAWLLGEDEPKEKKQVANIRVAGDLKELDDDGRRANST